MGPLLQAEYDGVRKGVKEKKNVSEKRGIKDKRVEKTEPLGGPSSM